MLVLLLLSGDMAASAGEGASADGGESEAPRLYEAALDHWMDRETRLQRIAQRIALAGAELCPEDLAPILGVSIIDTTALDKSLERLAHTRYGSGSRFVVAAVFEGMAGAKAGLKPGDVLLRWGTIEVERLHTWYANDKVHGTTSSLLVRRGDSEVRVDVENQRGCGFHTSIRKGEDEINAYATGRDVVFTDAYMRTQGDDVIANTVGHEFAHNILRHPGRRKHRDFWRSRRHEREADYLGLYLSARAGYESVESKWSDRVGLLGVFAFERGITHPTWQERTVLIQQTIDEISKKRANGEPLWPNEELQ